MCCSLRIFFFTAAALITLCACSGDGKKKHDIPRLHADGTRIVDSNGNTVVLRGVNLGGWMFHETWITCVDYASHGRIYLLAKESGIEADALAVMKEIGMNYGSDPAVIHVCPANGDKWIEGFSEGLKKRIGEEKAKAFMEKVSQYPALCDDADLSFRMMIEKRFGKEKRDELLDMFQGSWITEKDLEWISRQGFNLVRIPVGYRSLVTGSDAPVKPAALEWNQKAFDRLEELLDWCEEFGVYAVIDIQEAPGGQNTYAGKSGLFDDPMMQQFTISMWEYLSERFRDRNIVAAYSLLAEPYGAPTSEARDSMYDRLVKAIRAKSDDHLLVIHDGFMGMGTLPVPGDMGWSGVVYSTHMFEWQAENLATYDILLQVYEIKIGDAQKKHGVPYYIGSFSTFRDEEWAYEAAGRLVKWFDSHEWSWSLWTYKRIDDPLTMEIFGYTTAWGLRRQAVSAFDRPDLYLDSESTLAGKFASYADIEMETNQELLKNLTGHMETGNF